MLAVLYELVLPLGRNAAFYELVWRRAGRVVSAVRETRRSGLNRRGRERRPSLWRALEGLWEDPPPEILSCETLQLPLKC